MKTRRTLHPVIEPLETRIAPASLVTFTDADDDIYTIKLTGAGTADVVQFITTPGKGPIDAITFTGTTAKSALTITVKKSATGDGEVSIGSITGDSLASVSAAKSDLIGAGIRFLNTLGALTLDDVAGGSAIMLGGVATNATTMKLGDVADGLSITSGAAIKSLAAASLGTGVIMAPALGSLKSAGAIGADVIVAGAVGGLSAGGEIGGTLRAASFGNVAIKNGDFAGTLTALAPAGKKPGLASLAVSGGDFLGSITVLGGIGPVSAKAGKTGGGNFFDTIVGEGTARRPMIAGASLTSLSASAKLAVDLAIAGKTAKISSGSDATGEWASGSFGSIAVAGGSLFANLEGTLAIEMLANKPSLAKLTVTGGSLSSTIDLPGKIGSIAVAAKKGAGGSIDGSTITGYSIASVSAGAEVRDSIILSGAGSVGGPFGQGEIGKFSVKRGVFSSVVGAGLTSRDAIFNNGDDGLVSAGMASAIKSFSIGTEASADSFFAARAFPKTVKIGTAKVAPPADARFLTEGSADVRSPLLAFALESDTGLSNIDGITAVPTIAGRISDSGGFGSLFVKLDGGVEQQITTALRASGQFELTRAVLATLSGGALAEGDHTIELRATDATGNASATFDLDFTLTGFQIVAHTPAVGGNEVGLTFRPQVFFSQPVDPATLTAANFYASLGGQTLPATIVPAGDGSFAWLFFDDAMPDAAQITITVDGSTIMAADGSGALDAAGTGADGSTLIYNFSTVSQTPTAGTTLSGGIYDVGPDLMPHTTDDFDAGPDLRERTADDINKLPIANVKVFIIGREQDAVFTDAQGRFTITNVPAGNVKIVTDGLTATGLPAGYYFPEMVMDGQMQPGVDNAIMAGMPNIHLPRISNTILKPVDIGGTTMIGATTAGTPELTAAQRALLQIEIQPNSLVDADGNAVTNAEVGIATVPAMLVRDMLPAGLLQHTFDITVQSPDATNFTTPASMKFPNVFGAAPGTKLNFLSFDHTTGRLVIEGTATVSADGTFVTTDPETGITHPGWHGLTPPGGPASGPNPPNPPPQKPPPPCLDNDQVAESVMDFGKALLDCAASLTGIEGALKAIKAAFDAAVSLREDAIDLQNAMNANNDAAAFAAGFSAINNSKKGVIDAVDALKGQGDPVEKAERVIECVKAILESAKKICDRVDKGPCGNEISKIICKGLEIGNEIMSRAKQLADLAKAQEKGAKEYLQKSVCFLIAEIAKQLKAASAAALPRGGPANPVPQATLDTFDDFVDSLGTFTSETDTNGLGTLKKFADDITAYQAQAAGIFDNATDYYSTIHNSAKQSFYVFEYGNEKIRGRANDAGQFDVFLPANTAFKVTMYDHNSNRLATYEGVTNDSGATTEVPALAFVSTAGMPDSDGDGLVDAAENAVGTNGAKADTNGDGINDFAAVRAGLDPLAGVGFPTGVVATLAVTGTVNDVTVTGGQGGVGQTAYIAAGTGGLAIVDVAKPAVPVLLSQLALAGSATDVAIDTTTNIALVTSGAGGLHFVDVSNPLAPALVRTLNFNATQVEALDGIAYVVSGGSVRSFDAITGEPIQTLGLGGTITDLAREGASLFTMDTSNVLRAVDISGAQMVAHDTLALPQGGGQIFVSNNIAYAAAVSSGVGGFATANVSDIDDLTLISGADTPVGSQLAKAGIAVNGSGVALLVGTPFGPGGPSPAIEVLDAGDPANTGTLLTRFTLPAGPVNVSIAAGLAFVANGAAGLQIVNFRPFDTAGLAPTGLTLFSPVADADALAPGRQIAEGSAIPLRVSVTDDVQVRSVELLVNGALVASDVAAPFEFTITAPALASGATNLNVQVRATDTGGNSTLSNLLAFGLVADTAAPVLQSASPQAAGFNLRNINLRFNEAIEANLVALDGFTLLNLGADGAPGGGDDTTVDPANVRMLSPRTISLGLADALPFGKYQLTVDPAIIADLAGNALAAPIVHTFTSYDVDPNSILWISDANGNWNNPANWLGGVVPGANDIVAIKRIGAAPVVTIPAGVNVTIKQLISDEPLGIAGSLTLTDGESLLNGAVTITGGTLRAQGFGVLENTAAFNVTGGFVEALNGGDITLRNLAGTAIATNFTMEADGTGSTLSLPGLASLAGAIDFASVGVNAFNGGVFAAPVLAAIPSGTVRFHVFGAGSLIDLPALTTFTDTEEGVSLLRAENDGVLNQPLLTIIESVEIVARGAGSILDTAQIADIDTLDIRAEAGATLSFPGVTTITGNAFSTTIQADGASATINFPNLTTIHGAKDFASLNLNAYNTGAHLNFPALTTIPDGTVRIYAFDTGSLIDMPLLTAFTDTEEGTSLLRAERGSEVNAPLLTTLDAIEVIADGIGSILDTAQITDIDTLDIYARNGATLDFPGVTVINGNTFSTVIQADGASATINFPALATIHGSTNFASIALNAFNTGARLNFPALTTIPDGTVRIYAFDTGSLIDMPLLTAFTDTGAGTSQMRAERGSEVNAPLLTTLDAIEVIADGIGSILDTAQITDIDTLNIYARNGATLSFPGVTVINGNTFSTVIQADGASATINFPALATIHGSTNFASIALNAFNTGARLNFPALTTIPDGTVRIYAFDTGSLIDMPLLTAFTDTGAGTSQMRAERGSEVNAPLLTTLDAIEVIADGIGSILDTAQITDIDTLNIYARNGATFSFPGVTVINGNAFTTTIQAEFGGTLTFPALTTLHGATSFASLNINAFNSGAQIIFPALTAIPDGTVRIFNSGAGTLIDLPVLTTFNDTGAGTSLFRAELGGEINSPVLTVIESVDFVASHADSILDTAQLTDIDTLNIFAQNGAILTFPSVAVINGNAFTTTIQADSGSTLAFPALTTLHGASGFSSLNINSFNNASTVSFPVLTNIPDGAVRIYSSGAGADISLPALATFTDDAGATSLLRSENGSTLTLTTGTLALTAVEVRVDSQINGGGTLDLLAGTVLMGRSAIAMNILNTAGEVRTDAGVTGTLTIQGNFTQLAAGKLTWAAQGATSGVLADRFAVTGTAALGGTFALSVFNGYNPSIGTNFSALSASSVSGTFATLTGTSLAGGKAFTVSYAAAEVTVGVI